MDRPDPCRIPWPDDDAAIRRAARCWITDQPPPKTRADLRRQEAQILEDEYDAIKTRIGSLALESAPQIVLVAAMVQARMIFCQLIEAWQEYAREAELERNAQAMARAVDQWNSHATTDRSPARRPSDQDYMNYAWAGVKATQHAWYAGYLRSQGKYDEASRHKAEEQRLREKALNFIGKTYDGKTYDGKTYDGKTYDYAADGSYHNHAIEGMVDHCECDTDIAPTASDLWREATTESWPQHIDPEP